jgi:hypothetical protein
MEAFKDIGLIFWGNTDTLISDAKGQFFFYRGNG